MDALLFAAAITLHNLEEARWLPEWSRCVRHLRRPVEPAEFRFAVTAVTLLAWLASLLHVLHPGRPAADTFFIGFVGAMMINVVMPHLAATVAMRRYCPGLATGLLLLAPAGYLILRRAIGDGGRSIGFIAASTAIVGTVLLGLLPVLLLVGRRFGRRLGRRS